MTTHPRYLHFSNRETGTNFFPLQMDDSSGNSCVFILMQLNNLAFFTSSLIVSTFTTFAPQIYTEIAPIRDVSQPITCQDN